MSVVQIDTPEHQVNTPGQQISDSPVLPVTGEEEEEDSDEEDEETGDPQNSELQPPAKRSKT